jgi:hypothetical protein
MKPTSNVTISSNIHGEKDGRISVKRTDRIEMTGEGDGWRLSDWLPSNAAC